MGGSAAALPAQTPVPERDDESGGSIDADSGGALISGALVGAALGGGGADGGGADGGGESARPSASCLVGAGRGGTRRGGAARGVGGAGAGRDGTDSHFEMPRPRAASVGSGASAGGAQLPRRSQVSSQLGSLVIGRGESRGATRDGIGRAVAVAASADAIFQMAVGRLQLGGCRPSPADCGPEPAARAASRSLSSSAAGSASSSSTFGGGGGAERLGTLSACQTFSAELPSRTAEGRPCQMPAPVAPCAAAS
jgi:hypothetical protein